MTVYVNRRARYSKGTLKLRAPLKLPDGTEVRVTIEPLTDASKHRKAKPKFKYSTVTPPPGILAGIDGSVSLDEDALADSEVLYDGD